MIALLILFIAYQFLNNTGLFLLGIDWVLGNERSTPKFFEVYEHATNKLVIMLHMFVQISSLVILLKAHLHGNHLRMLECQSLCNILNIWVQVFKICNWLVMVQWHKKMFMDGGLTSQGGP